MLLVYYIIKYSHVIITGTSAEPHEEEILLQPFHNFNGVTKQINVMC